MTVHLAHDATASERRRLDKECTIALAGREAERIFFDRTSPGEDFIVAYDCLEAVIRDKKKRIEHLVDLMEYSQRIIRKNRKILRFVSEHLMKENRIDGVMVRAIVNGEV